MIFFEYWDKGYENFPYNYKINWEHNLKIINKMGLKYIFLDDKNIKKYIPIHKNFKYLYPAHKADYVRIYFCHLYGGIYIDCDCIIINEFHYLLKKLLKYDVILFADNNYNKNIDYMNGIVIMKKNKRFGDYFIKIMNNKLNTINEKYNYIKLWSFIGADIIGHIIYNKKIFNNEIFFMKEYFDKKKPKSALYFDWFITSKNNKENKKILYKKLFFKNENEAKEKAIELKRVYKNRYFLLTNRIHNFFDVDDIYFSKKSIIYHLMKQSLQIHKKG